MSITVLELDKFIIIYFLISLNLGQIKIVAQQLYRQLIQL